MMRLLPLVVLAFSAQVAAAADADFSYKNFKMSTLSVDNRSVDVFVPSCVHAKSPIILSLHAWATSEDLTKSIDRLPNYAGPECAVIVYPQGKAKGEIYGPFKVGFAWNAGGCCPNANTLKVDDFGYLDHVMVAVAQKFNVDQNMVFVVGISNGAMMANRLACGNDKVKAFVAVSGPLLNGTGDAAFQCDRNIPMLAFHGTADSVLPYAGCTSKTQECYWIAQSPGFPSLPWPTIPEGIADWRVRNHIAVGDKGSITFKNGSTSCTSWGSTANNVSFCTVGGEGHAWPGYCMAANKIPGMHCTYDVDASAQTMAFFRRYMPAPITMIV